MKTVLITVGSGGTINFIGQPKRYQELRKEILNFNKTNSYDVHLDNCIDELYYLTEDQFEDNLEEIIFRLLKYYHKLFEVDAKMKAEVFKGIKVKHYFYE